MSDQREKLLSLLDSFETNAHKNEDSDTDSLISGDDDALFSIETALDDLATFVGCLTKLGFSLDRPAPDPAPTPDKFRDISRGNQELLAYNRQVAGSQNYKWVQLHKPMPNNEERISASSDEDTDIRHVRRNLYMEATELFDQNAEIQITEHQKNAQQQQLQLIDRQAADRDRYLGNIFRIRVDKSNEEERRWRIQTNERQASA